ncbi:MAG: TrmH family RNA methyltransferase [Oligosphaeraceae bacterium]
MAMRFQEELTSLQNPRVKQVVRWRNRPDRDDSQVVLAEGYRALVRALAGGYPLKEIFVCPECFPPEKHHEEELLAQWAARGARLIRVAPLPFEKMCYRDRPEGLLGVGPQLHRGLEALKPAKNPFYLVAEQIEKPGNLGTIMRSSDAVGVDGLILCDSRTDLFNPNVVRASTGNLFTLPVAEATTRETIPWLKKKGVKILATSPHADPLYTQVDLTAPVAVAVGAEQYGLTKSWIEQADLVVRLPMMGEADSLNVSTATSILLYEVLRQRLDAGLLQDPGKVPDSADC